MGTVTDTVTSQTFAINDTTAADTITVTAGPVANGFQTTSAVIEAGASIIDFANKTNAFLNCSDDSDAITFSNPFVAAGLQSLTVENLGSGSTIYGFFSLAYVHVGSGNGSVAMAASGVMTIDAAIVPGAAIYPVSPYGTGEVLLGSFNTVSVGTGGSISTAIDFSGPGDVLQVTNAADNISGQIAGFSGGDFIDDQAIPFGTGALAVSWTENAGGSAGTLTVANGAQSQAYNINGNLSRSSFAAFSDGNGGTEIGVANAPPPTATTAVMVLRDGSDGDYEIYDLGNNAVVSTCVLGQIGIAWTVVGLGAFEAGDSSDMLMRSASGAFEVYDVGNNNITGSAAMGQVGVQWTVGGFGDFSSHGNETDMLMRNGNTGQFEIYDISNNAIASAASMGQAGLDWSIAGFGDFSTRANETDMLMRNSNTGAFELYDISNNAITSAAAMGQVGLEWSVAGFGDFSGNANETDMLMRNSSTGAFEIYDISNNAISAAVSMGQVGPQWSVVGFGPINGAGASDMLMRNSITGAFEVYDITNNQLTATASMGQVGLAWSVAGIAADPPGSANAQFAQAMASYATSDGALNTDVPIVQAAALADSSSMIAPPPLANSA